jgi:hypothetical protein
MQSRGSAALKHLKTGDTFRYAPDCGINGIHVVLRASECSALVAKLVQTPEGPMPGTAFSIARRSSVIPVEAVASGEDGPKGE